MAGPTTEVLNDDLKTVREDLHKLEVAVRGDIRELSTQVRGLLSSIRILGVLAITSLAASIWWGATLTADVKNLAVRIDDKAKVVEARLDRLEASVAKILEQTRPK
jgi:hypothetical protein